MGANQIEILPVVSLDVHKLEGILTLHDVLDSYGVNMPWPGLGLPGDSSTS
jgi:hypothetical protein